MKNKGCKDLNKNIFVSNEKFYNPTFLLHNPILY